VGPYVLGEGDSDFFQTFSLGKKSVRVDLKSEDGRRHFHKLVAGADAVANNVRGDQPARLGLDYAGLKAVKPAIVCAHLSAYGRTGERASWPGYDYLMQAEAGFLSLTGEPDGPPVRFGLSMVDYHAGSQMALGLVSAVWRAHRTGKGCDVDVALYDTALHQLSYPGTWYLNRGYVVERVPRSGHPTVAPSQLVRTQDGWGLLMCQTERFWQRFCDLAEAQSLREDPRFTDSASRREHIQALTECLDALFMQHTTQAWMDRLGGQVPFAPVLNVDEALENPFARKRAMIASVDHPDCEDGFAVLASPIQIDGERAAPRRAPKLGEHDGEFS
jgi:crotonobetainyl-CoA:carnitine CoA-transferase CaiB-like acyl-CoA transferase